MTVLVAMVLIIAALIAIHYGTLKEGLCPSCGRKVSFHFCVEQCSHCQQYFYEPWEDCRPLKAVKPGFISPYCSFGVNPLTLKHPSAWRLPWPERCCVCGNQATRSKKIKFKFDDYDLATGGPIRERKYQFNFGHCEKHENDEGCSCLKDEVDRPHSLSFRSFDYWNEFCQLNLHPWHYRQQQRRQSQYMPTHP